MLATRLFLGLFVFSVGNVAAKKLPSFLTPCKKDNSEQQSCGPRVVAQLRPYLAKGVRELGIPPCEPLIIPRMNLSQPETPGSNLGFEAVMTQLTYKGGTNFKLVGSNTNLETGITEILLNFPRVVCTGHYKATGRILVARFEGEGGFRGVYENITYYGIWKTEREQRDGKVYLKVTGHYSNIELSDMKTELENLFRNNKRLTDDTNQFIEDNKKLFYEEAKPIIVQTMSGIINTIINFVLNRYTLDELLTD